MELDERLCTRRSLSAPIGTASTHSGRTSSSSVGYVVLDLVSRSGRVKLSIALSRHVNGLRGIRGCDVNTDG